MTKAELLTEVDSKVLKTVAIEQQSDAVKEAAGVNSYIVNVMEQDGNKVTGRNIGFYVIGEGGAGEEAYYRDIVTPKSVARDALETYIAGLIPATYIRAEVQSVDEEDKYGWAQAWKDNGDGSATEVRLLVFKNGASPIEHREVAV